MCFQVHGRQSGIALRPRGLVDWAMRHFLFFIILTLLPLAAHASAPLVYRDKTKDAREDAALALLVERGKFVAGLPYQVAAKDLNDDGVDEWIFRQDRESACEANTSCRFFIVGLSDRTPVLLGDITARKIAVSDEKAYGVRRLYVYNNKNDDFAFSRYVWVPQNGAFLPQ